MIALRDARAVLRRANSLLFPHRHGWVGVTVTPIVEEGAKVGFLRLEQCRCGAVRSIECRLGKSLVVRMAEAVSASCAEVLAQPEATE